MNLHDFFKKHQPQLAEKQYGKEPRLERILSSFYGMYIDKTTARKQASEYCKALEDKLQKYFLNELKAELSENFSPLPEIVRNSILNNVELRLKKGN